MLLERYIGVSDGLLFVYVGGGVMVYKVRKGIYFMDDGNY